MPARVGGGVHGHGAVRYKNAVCMWNSRWRAAGRQHRCEVVTEPPWHGRVRARALAETHGHGPSWATSPQALPI
jgi:hypothetical protein